MSTKGDRCRGGAQGKQGVETRCRGYLRQPCSSTGDCDYDGGGENGGGDGGEGEGEGEGEDGDKDEDTYSGEQICDSGYVVLSTLSEIWLPQKRNTL